MSHYHDTQATTHDDHPKAEKQGSVEPKEPAASHEPTLGVDSTAPGQALAHLIKAGESLVGLKSVTSAMLGNRNDEAVLEMQALLLPYRDEATHELDATWHLLGYHTEREVDRRHVSNEQVMAEMLAHPNMQTVAENAMRTLARVTSNIDGLSSRLPAQVHEFLSVSAPLVGSLAHVGALLGLDLANVTTKSESTIENKVQSRQKGPEINSENALKLQPPKASSATLEGKLDAIRPFKFGEHVSRHAHNLDEAPVSKGAFDEAEKYFPTLQPEYGPPKPKDRPQPLGLDSPMQFNGVVGRSSLSIATTLTNPNNRAVAVAINVSGTDFHLSSTTDHIEPAHAGDNVTDVFIKYVPTTPGTTQGQLHIITTFDEEPGVARPAVEQHIELSGTATTLEHLKPSPSDGSPRTIPDLTAEDKHVTPHQQAKNDLDALTGLADTYRTIVGANDAAVFEMIDRIGATTFEFGEEIGQWVRAELPTNKMSEASTAGKLAWKAVGAAIGKGIEMLEMSTVVTAAVGVVADVAWDRLEERVFRDPQSGAKKAAGSAAREMGSELIAATNLRVKIRMNALTTNHIETRAKAQQLAGRMAMEREKAAQESLAGQSYEHPSTVEFVNDFREALDRYSDAVRAIAATATQLHPSLVASFNELRMHYVQLRASKSSDLTYRVDYAAAWDLGSEDSQGRETFRVFEPSVRGFTNFSEPMRNFIVHRKLSDYAADADVFVRVNCKQGGYVIIEKKVGMEATFKEFTGTAAIQAAMRGPQLFWSFLEEHIG